MIQIVQPNYKQMFSRINIEISCTDFDTLFDEIDIILLHPYGCSEWNFK